MRLKVLGSSSKGNCYILYNDKESLLLECGVGFGEIKKGLNFNLRSVVGCLLTHEHGDHAKSIYDVLLSGIPVYASAGTHYALSTSGNLSARFVCDQQKFEAGSFRVMAFDVKHDCAEPLGFLINHPETGNVLFLTDTYYSQYRFSRLNNILVEANYSKEILKQKQELGLLPHIMKDRVIQSHMSIETCKELLKANDLSQVNNIVLIHLSDGNSDEQMFRDQVSKLTGKTVHIADRGMDIELNKTPF